MIVRRLLCNVLAVLKMHSQDCDHCKVHQDCWGIDIRKRLQELAQQEQPPEDRSTGPLKADLRLRVRCASADECIHPSNGMRY